MASVREVTFDLFREHGMTTIFGNPGSTELPMLAEFPDDFRYVLGLQEAVAVGMADGFAQASGGPAHVNLHTAPGVGNGMGAIFNAQANHSPLVVTAGQQVRAAHHAAGQPDQSRRDAHRPPVRQVELRAATGEDVPHALARAIHIASLPPKGPAFVSLPMDDWDAEADAHATGHASSAHVTGRAAARPGGGARRWPQRLAGGAQPGAGRRSRHRRERRLGGGRRAGRAPAPAGLGHARAGRRAARLPGEPSRSSRASCRRRSARVAETLAGHDLSSWSVRSVFPYYPYIPGPPLPEGAALVAITSDPDEAARAPMGDALVADLGARRSRRWSPR